MADRRGDEHAAVRDGEQLDRAALGAWLESSGLGALGEIRQFPSGHSNLTYLIHVDDRELVLRRPPLGRRVASGHDMAREYRVLSALADGFGKAPAPVALCEDETILGAPFYLMERVRGRILRAGAAALDAGAMAAACRALVETLAEIHSVDPEHPGLAELGRPAGYVRRQVEGWSRRDLASRTEERPCMDQLAKWLAENAPLEAGTALIHNDFKYDNLVLDPEDSSRVLAVLDWEMATRGCPLMDLGTSLGYWFDADDPEALRALPSGPTAAPGNLDRRGVAELYGRRYKERTGRDLDHIVFYYAYGLYKIAVILQQIYQRWHRGQTGDKRFAGFLVGASALADQGLRAIERGRIDDLA